MFHEIDIDRWERRATYEHFKDYDDPFFNMTANLNVSRLYRFCKENDLAFSLAGLYFSLETANEIREFRLRLMDDKIIEFDAIHATQTILNDDDTFSFCYFERQPDVFEFDIAGKAAREKYKALKTYDVETGRIDLIYYSVIPWISFTSFKHASRIDKSQAVPRMVFGKIFDEGGEKKMPFSVEANHAIMDGFHVGKYFNQLQARIDAI